MIIIYNLSGLLIGLLGIVVGFLVFAVSGWLSAGLLVLGMIWMALGRGKLNAESGLKTPAPSLFFIPLFALAIPILLLAILAVSADVQRSKKVLDPRSALLDQDEKTLNRTKLTGDSDLALAAYDALKPVALDDKMHVFAVVKDQRTLVLAKIPSLKEIDKSARASMVKALVTALETQEAVKDLPLYLGIKGRFAYGVVHTPAGTTIDSTVSPDPLLGFYGPPVPARPTVR
ncbi:hypothetical protein SAMN05444166_4250 [Singulisphaera sp. GP187]|uniref:hypothetical protein n=1 Tax=Singulisphaera sp. GP187 TaxID=1882752 RepID=UPI000926066E|nr:hypothetical protein [Singulisphaera sp. GP187]SIO38208.1 hypothetical protein SAMN05444166_4250 [Singulisphaera sp. GP187]